ncbi:short transient receptor potential channel 4-like [Ptychodera flava]|uniref:short transient receptor potential channel 4-like n=1 Tax=Ptychodera flava TaxID=63121 RepID=UPI00396A119A
MSYLHLLEEEKNKAYSQCCRSSVKDCVQVAFELVQEMTEFLHRQKLNIWKRHYDAFNDTIERLTAFSIELLSCCYTADEVRWFMEGGFYDHRRCTCECCFGICKLERLTSCTYDRDPKRFIIAEKAIQTKQKMFIAQCRSQSFLKKEWLKGQPQWSKNKGIFWRLLYAIFAFFVYGILYPLLPPHTFTRKSSRLHRLLYSPKSAFLSHYFNYFFLIVSIFSFEVLVSYKVEGSDIKLKSEVDYIPILVMGIIWFVTLSMTEIGQLISQGPCCYFKNYWNILDLTILVCFFIGMILGNPEIVGDNPYTVYMSKATSLTFIFALLRFMQPFYLSYFIGPILLIYTKMRYDIVRFFFICGYVVTAYALAMYYFYVGVVQNQSEFTEFSSSLKSLVLTIFGGDVTDSLSFDKPLPTNATDLQKRIWTVSRYFNGMGYILYILFGIIVLIVLLNLCIAMMSDRYTRLQADIDLEWKFERSRIWLEYIVDQGSNSNALTFVFYLLLICVTPPILYLYCLCFPDEQHKKEGPSTEFSMMKVTTNPREQTSEECISFQDEGNSPPLNFSNLLKLLLKRYLDKHARPLSED